MYTILIGNKNYSSWSMRPWVVLQHFDIPFKENKIFLKTAEANQTIERFSSNKKVPCLIVDDDFIISDSLAICEYLAEQFPQKNLWPKDSSQRAKARSIVCEMHSGFENLRATFNMNIKRKPQEKDIQTRLSNQLLVDEIRRIEQMWTELLTQNGQYLFGEFSIADAFFSPAGTRFRSYNVKLNDICEKYIDTLLNTKGIKEWIEGAYQEEVVIQDYEV